jgi:hypothetical protein
MSKIYGNYTSFEIDTIKKYKLNPNSVFEIKNVVCFENNPFLVEKIEVYVIECSDLDKSNIIEIEKEFEVENKGQIIVFKKNAIPQEVRTRFKISNAYKGENFI